VNKRNLIIQAAVAGLFSVATLSAYASGSLSNAIGNSAQIATQAVSAASVIGAGSIQYTVEGAIPIGTYYVYVQLNGGATFAAGATPVTTIDSGALVAAGTGATVTVGAGVVLANTSIVAFPVTVSVAAMPANSTFTFKPLGVTAADGGIANAVGVATPGSSLNATMSLGASASYSPTLTAIVQDEATASTAPIATFVSGITATALSSGLFTGTSLPLPFTGVVGTETAIINVISGSGTALTNNVNVPSGGPGVGTELIDLGGFYFSDVSADTTTTNPGTGADSAPFAADALTTFNITNDYTGAGSGISATLTAPAGFFNVVGTTGSVYLSATATCTAAVASGVGTINASGSTVTFAGITTPALTTIAPATNKVTDPLYVCVQAATTHTPLWVSGTPSITATLAGTTADAVTSISLPATSLYPLLSNGGTVIVREYVPAAATATSGYQSFIRVINTGAVSSPISFAFIDDVAGGTAGASGATAAVPAGGAITLNSATIEGLSGIGKVSSSTARPRVQVTASTTITVQSYLYNAAANVFTEVSGGSNGNGGSGIVPATGQ
jgi:hypothetical protein